MNIHHLELFYFISTYGGITEAARKMPYGIQQPAISAQILRLEEDLGLKLFQRRPFQLTPAGRELYEFVAPFFSRVQETSQRLRGESAQRLRLAALTTILRDHLPILLVRHRRRFPHLKLRLHDANQAHGRSAAEEAGDRSRNYGAGRQTGDGNSKRSTAAGAAGLARSGKSSRQVRARNSETDRI